MCSNVALGKFGTFNSDKLIGKPFGLSYEILGKDDHLRPVGHVSKNTIVGKKTKTKKNKGKRVLII